MFRRAILVPDRRSTFLLALCLPLLLASMLGQDSDLPLALRSAVPLP